VGCSLWGEGVSKRYGGLAVLDGASWRFTGRLTLLLAPNGAGKTTLLRLSLGLARPDRGSAGVCAGPGEVSWLLDYGGPPQWAPAWRVVVFLLGLRGVRVGERGARRLLLEAGLPEGAHARPFGALSTGQRRLALLAAALYGEPEVVVLDEPLAGLDPRMRARVSRLVNGASRSSRVVVATHIVSLLEASEVYTLRGGRVVGPREPPRPPGRVPAYDPVTGETVLAEPGELEERFLAPLGV